MTYVTYTSTGPFNNGSAPGISATFLNNIETMLAAGWFDSQITSNGAGIETVAGLVTGASLLNLGAHTGSINGSTSGTFTLYEWMTGTNSFKAAVGIFNNYKNAGSALSLALNAPFTSMAFIGNLGGNGLQLWSGGSQLSSSIYVLTSLSSSGGATSGTTNLPTNAIGMCNHAFDSIHEPGGNASAATGIAFFLGL